MKWFFSFLVWLLPFASSIEAKDFIAPSKERFLLFYSPYFVELLQVMYGAEGVISQGGTPSIEDLFIGVDLEGKDILDLGSGLG
ncbi:MAG: hypothetical protein FJZ58_03320, partial [Chlamydiae bacterium]|nr:hypothetical protein [Chlamydiota bacterium]